MSGEHHTPIHLEANSHHITPPNPIDKGDLPDTWGLKEEEIEMVYRFQLAITRGEVRRKRHHRLTNWARELFSCVLDPDAKEMLAVLALSRTDLYRNLDISRGNLEMEVTDMISELGMGDLDRVNAITTEEIKVAAISGALILKLDDAKR